MAYSISEQIHDQSISRSSSHPLIEKPSPNQQFQNKSTENDDSQRPHNLWMYTTAFFGILGVSMEVGLPLKKTQKQKNDEKNAYILQMGSIWFQNDVDMKSEDYIVVSIIALVCGTFGTLLLWFQPSSSICFFSLATVCDIMGVFWR